MSFDERIQKLLEIQRGWINNFKHANIFRNWRNLMVGFVTALGTVFGITGRIVA